MRLFPQVKASAVQQFFKTPALHADAPDGRGVGQRVHDGSVGYILDYERRFHNAAGHVQFRADFPADRVAEAALRHAFRVRTLRHRFYERVLKLQPGQAVGVQNVHFLRRDERAFPYQFGKPDFDFIPRQSEVPLRAGECEYPWRGVHVAVFTRKPCRRVRLLTVRQNITHSLHFAGKVCVPKTQRGVRVLHRHDAASLSGNVAGDFRVRILFARGMRNFGYGFFFRNAFFRRGYVSLRLAVLFRRLFPTRIRLVFAQVFKQFVFSGNIELSCLQTAENVGGHAAAGLIKGVMRPGTFRPIIR